MILHNIGERVESWKWDFCERDHISGMTVPPFSHPLWLVCTYFGVFLQLCIPRSDSLPASCPSPVSVCKKTSFLYIYIEREREWKRARPTGRREMFYNASCIANSARANEPTKRKRKKRGVNNLQSNRQG